MDKEPTQPKVQTLGESSFETSRLKRRSRTKSFYIAKGNV